MKKKVELVELQNNLYATVSQDVESIKKGDYAIHKSFGLGQIKDVRGQECFVTSSRHVGDGSVTTPWKRNIPDIRKVITTTNPRLMLLSNNGRVGYNYPQISEEAIKEFIDNPNGEFDVEYEWEQSQLDSHIYGLKLNQDNTINITLVKERMYSLSDLERLGDYAYMNAKSTWDWKKFIKENL